MRTSLRCYNTHMINTANETQEKLLQKMNGKARLEQAFQLSDFVHELAKINIKQTSGVENTKMVLTKFQQRLYPQQHMGV
jgi:hypothetical protein